MYICCQSSETCQRFLSSIRWEGDGGGLSDEMLVQTLKNLAATQPNCGACGGFSSSNTAVHVRRHLQAEAGFSQKLQTQQKPPNLLSAAGKIPRSMTSHGHKIPDNFLRNLPRTSTTQNCLVSNDRGDMRRTPEAQTGPNLP